MAREELIKAVAVTAELTGTEMSEAAARLMVDDLSVYPPEHVFRALDRCRRELRSRLTLADVIARLDDGRPGPEEAWAMIPRDEADAVVWSEEMRVAYGVAAPLLAQGDDIGARMAFKETYTAEVTKTRAEQRPPDWQLSGGFNQGNRLDAEAQRKAAVREAVERGRISRDTAEYLLPDYREPIEPARRLEGPSTPSVFLQNIETLRNALDKGKEGGAVAEKTSGKRDIPDSIKPLVELYAEPTQ